MNLSLPSFITPRVFSILLMETAERFTYYGFRAVLVLYFRNFCQFSESTSISLFAYITCLAYLSPVFGAVVSDSYLGRFQTILIFGIVYLIGLVVLTIGGFLPVQYNDENSKDTFQPNSHTIPLTFLGLFLICIGTGGIKPCVSAFGADQVQTGNENNRSDAIENTVIRKDDTVQEFYSWFYFCINLGSVGSYIIVPTVRSNYGYSAAFLLSTIFLMIAMLCFISRKNEYTIHIPVKSSTLLQKSDEHHNSQNEKTAEPCQSSDPSLYCTFQIVFYLLRGHIVYWWKGKFSFTRKQSKRKQSYEMIGSYDTMMKEDDHKLKSSSDNEILNRNIMSTKTIHSNNPSETNLQSEKSIVKSLYEIENDDGNLDDRNDALNAEIFLKNKFSDEQIQNAQSALKVIPVLCMLPAFWMLYDQHSSVWTLQATHMALHGVQPEQLGAINPILIMILIPLFDRIIYPTLREWNWNISHLRRMAVGMFLASVSFVVSALLEWNIKRKENGINVAWQLPQIFIISTAEILVSVTGLEFSYTYSPPSMKAMIMALYLMTSAVGNFCGGLLYTFLGNLDRDLIMLICAALMVVNLIFFRRVVNAWESSNHSEVVDIIEHDLSSLLPADSQGSVSPDEEKPCEINRGITID